MRSSFMVQGEVTDLDISERAPVGRVNQTPNVAPHSTEKSKGPNALKKLFTLNINSRYS